MAKSPAPSDGPKTATIHSLVLAIGELIDELIKAAHQAKKSQVIDELTDMVDALNARSSK